MSVTTSNGVPYVPHEAKRQAKGNPKKLTARGEARKGRGFGFVTLASEELQQKAVSGSLVTRPGSSPHRK
ncbi:RNP domain protein [Apiospora marii]|uniref:RNP domain protein n=1 Tax=Apiospora marii TaxID=335849 RepID=UPI003130AFA2